VDIRRGQQFTTTRCDPAFTRTGLTLRAVPIAATNGELPITCLMGSFF
jgi:hypothetical protein